MAATMAFASTPQLRGILADILEGGASSYTLECQSEREAALLRGRLNKLRATDRSQMQKVYAEQKIHLPETGVVSSYDTLTFRVVDTDVVVERAPFNDEDLKALVRPTSEPRKSPPPEGRGEKVARQYAQGRQNVVITGKPDEPLTIEDLNL